MFFAFFQTYKCTLYNVLYIVQRRCKRTGHIIQRTVYRVLCTLYIAHCTVYSVNCTAYAAQCTVYVRYIFICYCSGMFRGHSSVWSGCHGELQKGRIFHNVLSLIKIYKCVSHTSDKKLPLYPLLTLCIFCNKFAPDVFNQTR